MTYMLRLEGVVGQEIRVRTDQIAGYAEHVEQKMVMRPQVMMGPGGNMIKGPPQPEPQGPPQVDKSRCIIILECGEKVNVKHTIDQLDIALQNIDVSATERDDNDDNDIAGSITTG